MSTVVAVSIHSTDNCSQRDHTSNNKFEVYSTPQADATPQNTATLPSAMTTHSQYSACHNSTKTITEAINFTSWKLPTSTQYVPHPAISKFSHSSSQASLASLEASFLSPSPTLLQSVTLTKITNTDCSHSLIPQSMWILFTVMLMVLLIVCIFLIILLCTLTFYYKRSISTLIADKESIHSEDLLANGLRSRKGNSPCEHLPPHDQFVIAVNVYDTTTSMNQSFFDKSVYLVNQTVSEVDSLEDSLHSVDILPMKVNAEPKSVNTNFSLEQAGVILKCEFVEDGMGYQVRTVDFCDESGIAHDSELD